MLFSLSLCAWANATQWISWERKGLSSQFEATVRARKAWCQEYETHTQERERDQCGSHPLMPLFPFSSVCNCSTEQLMLRPSFPLQLVYLGIFSKTSPEGCFFLPYDCRSCTVDNVNHHRSTKWSLPQREHFLNPVSSHSPAQNHHSKNCYIQLHQTSFPLSSYHMMHRVEFAFTML